MSERVGDDDCLRRQADSTRMLYDILLPNACCIAKSLRSQLRLDNRCVDSRNHGRRCGTDRAQGIAVVDVCCRALYVRHGQAHHPAPGYM